MEPSIVSLAAFYFVLYLKCLYYFTNLWLFFFSFITQQPDSLDTIRSCSSGGTYSSATTFTSEPSSTEQTPRSTGRSNGHSSRSNNDSKRDTPRSKNLGPSHYSRSIEDVRGNAPLPPVSSSTTTQMIHGVDFGPLNSESSTDYLEASSGTEM